MSVIDFFEYLAGHEQTRELAFELADAWTSSTLDAVFEPAA
jgi:hypothetical protein